MHRLPRSLRLLMAICGIVLVFVAWTEGTRPVRGPHGRLALALFRSGLDSLPVLHGTYFWTSGRCAGCHGRDLLGQASIDPANGQDVNVVDDWRSTLMANSARDPFFRAKLDHEMLVNPAHADAISTKCLSCHAPLAVFEEKLLGNPPFTAAMLDTSTFAGDGASCLACHMQDPDSAGLSFSGKLQFDSAMVYGPYTDDQINPNIMQFFVGLTPTFGAHILNSRVCADCHTLVTGTIDLDGNITGDQFVEQATYHEWKNSVYSTNGTNCNTCHMPRIEGPVILAAEYAFLNGQTPFGLHHLAGANVHMLELMKANREVLGIPATAAQFDSTIARTKALLSERTLEVDVDLDDRTADTAYFAVRLTNRAGHRFPSGFPSRRAFIRFVVQDAAGDTLFVSGAFDGTHEVAGHDPVLEPHHDVIRDAQQVQIYELVMGDVNGDPTTVLDRAKSALKDNRLVPLGFSTAHPSYDTTRIAGDALTDPDFNRTLLNEEGSGTDVVHYHVPLNGIPSALRARAEVFYQSMPPAWNAEMFAFQTERIDAFRSMLEASDGRPRLVAADSMALGPLGIPLHRDDRMVLLPNPTGDGVVELLHDEGDRVDLVSAHDARGREVGIARERRPNGWRITLPDRAGVYILRLVINGRTVLHRAVRQ